MTRSELVKSLAEKAGTTQKVAKDILDALCEVITENSKSLSDTDIGVGKFKTVEKAAREGIVPGTDKKYSKPASKAVKFNPGKTLKEAINS